MRTIIIRNLDEETYTLLWQMRKFYKAGSWAKLMKIITREFQQQTMEDWL